jgi:hypothetical protein
MPYNDLYESNVILERGHRKGREEACSPVAHTCMHTNLALLLLGIASF